MRCPVHLERNLVTHFGTLGDAMKSLYWKARDATTHGAHLRAMLKIKESGEVGVKIHDYLVKVENWQLYVAVLRGNVLYCMRSNNLSEQVFAWTLDARSLSPPLLIKKILKDVFFLVTKQCDRAMKHKVFITPFAEEKMAVERLSLISADTARSLKVYPCSDISLGVATVGYAGDTVTLGWTWNVCMRTGTCSCGLMKQICGPCRHFYVVAEHFKIPITSKHFSRCVTTAFWREMYLNCPSLVGVFPTDNQVDDLVRVRAAQGVATQVVKAWVEIDEIVTLSQQRYSSNGDSIGGGGISMKRKRKSDKRPCTRCSKLVSGFTRHKAKACLKFRILVSKTRFLAFGEQMVAARASELCFTYNRAAVRDSLSLMGLDQATEDEVETTVL
jgi:hypothetical protein